MTQMVDNTSSPTSPKITDESTTKGSTVRGARDAPRHEVWTTIHLPTVRLSEPPNLHVNTALPPSILPSGEACMASSTRQHDAMAEVVRGGGKPIRGSERPPRLRGSGRPCRMSLGGAETKTMR